MGTEIHDLIKKLRTGPMVVDGIDRHRRGKQQERDELSSKTRFSLGVRNKRADAGREGRTCRARPNSEA